MNLLCFLVESVCSDYANAYAMYRKNPHSQEHCKRLNALRNYIESDYFCNLTSLDGSHVIKLIETNHNSLARNAMRMDER